MNENHPLSLHPRREIEVLAAEITALKTQRRVCAVELDAHLHDLRQRYATVLRGLDQDITTRMERARRWAEANPNEFGMGRTLRLAGAEVGYRPGLPRLKTLEGWSWNRVLKKLKALPWNGGLVEVKEEVNQQQILMRRDELGAERLAEIGLRVEQEEKLFVEPRGVGVARLESREDLAA